MNQPESARSAAPDYPATKPKSNALAIWGLVLSCLFFLPLVPTIGLILGIVALATGRHKTISIVAICVGGFFTLFLGLEAAIAIPAFMKYIRRSKTVEVRMNLGKLAASIRSLDEAQWSKLAESDWTPAQSACTQPNARFAPNPSLWQVEPWTTLSFSVDDPAYYQYRVRRDAQGLVVEAQGDLDCDGVLAHFWREIRPDGGGPLQSENELE
jgi:hypothetical protein